MAPREGVGARLLLNVIGPRMGRCVLIAIGVGVLVAAFWQPNGGDPLGGLALSLGVLMVTLGCLIPWLISAKAGPEGVSVQIRARPERTELTTFFAESKGPQRVRDVRTEQVDAARFLAAENVLSAWFNPSDGPLAGCNLHLFLFDDERGLLLPALEEDEVESRGWAPGQGVTGEAYRTGNYVLATGAECSDDTYGLTEDQQKHYKGLTAVAACPVWSGDGTVVAVLAAATEAPDPRLATTDGQEELVFLALMTARILIDLLGWFVDNKVVRNV